METSVKGNHQKVLEVARYLFGDSDVFIMRLQGLEPCPHNLSGLGVIVDQCD